jgi:hypothetical protein
MIEKVPTKAVIRAAETERRMLEEDLGKQRISPNEETTSVMAFCNFLEAAAHGGQVSGAGLPVEHCAFYRKTVHRLVEAGELPFEAKESFEHTFSGTPTKALKSPG